MNLATYRQKLAEANRTLTVLDKACRAFPVDMTGEMKWAYDDLCARRRRVERMAERYQRWIDVCQVEARP